MNKQKKIAKKNARAFTIIYPGGECWVRYGKLKKNGTRKQTQRYGEKNEA